MSQRLETIHFRHSDVEKDGREVVIQEVAESRLAGIRHHQLFVEPAQCGFQRNEILGGIVHQQNLHAPVCANFLGHHDFTGRR